MMASAFPSAIVNLVGMTPSAIRTCPAPMATRLQNAVILQDLEPSLEMFSRATKAKAPHRTGPQPVR